MQHLWRHPAYVAEHFFHQLHVAFIAFAKSFIESLLRFNISLRGHIHEIASRTAGRIGIGAQEDNASTRRVVPFGQAAALQQVALDGEICYMDALVVELLLRLAV